jgi:hypothetical protein
MWILARKIISREDCSSRERNKTKLRLSLRLVFTWHGAIHVLLTIPSTILCSVVCMVVKLINKINCLERDLLRGVMLRSEFC